MSLNLISTISCDNKKYNLHYIYKDELGKEKKGNIDVGNVFGQLIGPPGPDNYIATQVSHQEVVKEIESNKSTEIKKNNFFQITKITPIGCKAVYNLQYTYMDNSGKEKKGNIDVGNLLTIMGSCAIPTGGLSCCIYNREVIDEIKLKMSDHDSQTEEFKDFKITKITPLVAPKPEKVSKLIENKCVNNDSFLIRGISLSNETKDLDKSAPDKAVEISKPIANKSTDKNSFLTKGTLLFVAGIIVAISTQFLFNWVNHREGIKEIERMKANPAKIKTISH